jgi:hypothetical protein
MIALASPAWSQTTTWLRHIATSRWELMRKPKNKSIRIRSSGRTDAERDVELFLANEQVDQIADYASRGRAYERLTDGELAEKWIHAFRLFADAPSDERRRAIEIDLKAEFQLRSIEPPYDQVRSDINRIVKNTSSSFETMKRNDPDGVDEINEEFQQDLADLKARIKQSN